jgi:hypothetical protein
MNPVGVMQIWTVVGVCVLSVLWCALYGRAHPERAPAARAAIDSIIWGGAIAAAALILVWGF